MKLRFIRLLLCVGVVPLTHASAADLIGVAYNGVARTIDTFRINPQTGNGSAIGPSGVALLNDLARSPDGTIWTAGLVYGDLQHHWLIRIDPFTGAGAPGPMLNYGGVDAESADALAFSPAGQLFAVSLNDYLFRINLSTGAGTLVGRIGVAGSPIGVQAIAFAPNGTLYGWGVERYGLVTIDPQTAAFTDVSASYGGGGFIQGMTFGEDGVLYGARDVLYRINTSTGAATQIGAGDGFQDVRGIAVIPEPSLMALAPLALAALRFRRR